MHRIMKSTLPFAIFAASAVLAQQADFQDYSSNPAGMKNSRISNQPSNQNGNAMGADGAGVAQIDRSAAENAAFLIKNKKQEKSEFQNFVEYATGKQLPLFGEDFFSLAHRQVLLPCKIRQFHLITYWGLATKS